MPRLVHFEIHASNPERIIDFYSKMFGWTFAPYGPAGQYWLITTGEAPEPGINGGLVPRQGSLPAHGQAVNAFVCTVDVDSLDAHVEKLMSLGGTLALPKMPVPSVGWLAYGKDPDGNLFGMLQADTSAK
jgi:predicted enzyme related to lactoylglutathione lyase